MEIKYVKNDSADFEAQLGINLHKYNQENCEYIRNNSTEKSNNKTVYNIAVYDNDILIGGFTGWSKLGWYYLDQLWIEKSYRKHKIGSKLMEEISSFAISNNCVGIITETWSFQAKDFYIKNGFEIYASLDNFPPGATVYFLKKVL